MSNDLSYSDNASLVPSRPSPREEAKAARPSRPRELTGRTVLYMLLAFFGVIIGVNAFMAHEALSTFGGVETDSSYKAGQMFEHDVARAKAQDAQHWRVDAKVTPAADGTALIDIVARDASARRSQAWRRRPCSSDPRTAASIAPRRSARLHRAASTAVRNWRPGNGISSLNSHARANGCFDPKTALL